MEQYQNPKIIGACLIGFTIVGGTYVLSNFGEARHSQTTGMFAVAANEPLRFPIEVQDTSGNGIEDWRDQFVSSPTIQLGTSSAPTLYTPPETITERLGVNLMEGFFASLGPVPIKPRERVISDTVTNLEKMVTSDEIYDIRDIIIGQDVSDLAVKNYGNALALIIQGDGQHNLRNELVILRDYQELGGEKYLEQLKTLSNTYKRYRDETLKLRVPSIFAKQHLDLINVFHALHLNIEAMTKSDVDPIVPFMRLKRYEEDVEGLALAMHNMYEAFATRANVFGINDPAILFVKFSRNR